MSEFFVSCSAIYTAHFNFNVTIVVTDWIRLFLSGLAVQNAVAGTAQSSLAMTTVETDEIETIVDMTLTAGVMTAAATAMMETEGIVAIGTGVGTVLRCVLISVYMGSAL